MKRYFDPVNETVHETLIDSSWNIEIVFRDDLLAIIWSFVHLVIIAHSFYIYGFQFPCSSRNSNSFVIIKGSPDSYNVQPGLEYPLTNKYQLHQFDAKIFTKIIPLI